MAILPEQMFILLIFIFIIGTVFGSFLNVVILRAFSGESIVLPPSKCPKCGNKLKWYHNIPILSYLFLRGKCGFCKEKISIQYPIVEFITGVLFALIFLKYGIRIETLFGFIIASLLMVISVTDIKERVVFDAHTYTFIGAGLVYALYLTVMQIVSVNQSSTNFQFTVEWILNNPLTLSILGGVVGALIMEIAARSGYLLAGKRAFGEGDTYIAAGLGTIFGLKNILFILILSVIIQLIFTVPMFIINLIKSKNWKTLISLSLFTLFAVLFYIMQYSTLVYNDVLRFLSITLLAVSGIAACIFILKGIRNEQHVTYLPFGPAMALAGLIVLLIV